MISDKDRSGWFGASDVRYILAKNRSSPSWAAWWLAKLGIAHKDFASTAMLLGTHKEHQILEYIGAVETDKQLLLPEICLRVNLDGNTGKKIHEVKTHKDRWTSVPSSYVNQVQVQMFAFGTEEAEIVDYLVDEEDAKNFFLPIDPERLHRHEIAYDRGFIEERFLPALCELAEAMRKGVMPE